MVMGMPITKIEISEYLICSHQNRQKKKETVKRREHIVYVYTSLIANAVNDKLFMP